MTTGATVKKKPSLTEEEQKELDALTADATAQKEESVVARKRQHLQALKLAKAQSGKRGLDFEVVETTAGNFAVRRPVDLEVRAFTDGEHEEEVKLQEFLCGITVFPEAVALKTALSSFPALGMILANTAMALCGKRLEEEGK